MTTLAINTAFIMAEKLSRRTALVDMDIYAGNIALALDIEPTRGLREAFDDPERVDEVFLQNAMAKFGKSLHVLATEEGFDDTVRMTDDKVLMLADTMRANFDMSIMDMPAALRDARAGAVHPLRRHRHRRRADAAVAARLQPAGEADGGAQPPGQGARRSPTRCAQKPDVTVKEFEAGMEAKLRCVFPHDSKAMTKASLKGQPLAASDPKHKMVADLHKLCIELAGVPEEAKQAAASSSVAFKRK